jgi:hypothetical protein
MLKMNALLYLLGNTGSGIDNYMAVSSKSFQLRGGNILLNASDAIQLKPKERGRPEEITDEILFPRRDTLLGIFEYHWAEVAWELQRAGTPESIRQAFQPISNPQRDELDFFLRETTQEATFKEFRAMRRVKSGLGIEFRKALTEEREAQEALNNVLGALQDRLSNAGTERLLHIYQRRYSQAKKHLDYLHTRIDAEENNLREQGAFLAQSELLNFIDSQRYSLCPMSFANAMAGLPFITWRRSTARCKKQEENHPFLNIYELFLEVERALAGPPQKAKLAIEQVKAHLIKSKRQSNQATQTLREEWYYLRVAIETAYSQEPPRGAIPFQVFTEYLRRSSRRSQLDQVLAKEERL